MPLLMLLSPNFFFLFPLSINSMEGCNAYIADCVVISCCCQCLILQLVVFLLLELPRRTARKTREYAKKKLGQRRRKKRKQGETDLDRAQAQRGESLGLDVGRSRRMLELEGIEIMDKVHRRGQCMEEVEKVLEELSTKGEFAFGSFWGRDNLERGRVMSCSKYVMSREDLQYGGCHAVNFQLIEVVEPG